MATGPNLYHLQCGSNTHNEMGVAADRVHGFPPSICMGAEMGPAGCGDSKTAFRDLQASAKVRSEIRPSIDLLLRMCSNTYVCNFCKAQKYFGLCVLYSRVLESCPTSVCMLHCIIPVSAVSASVCNMYAALLSIFFASGRCL